MEVDVLSFGIGGLWLDPLFLLAVLVGLVLIALGASFVELDGVGVLVSDLLGDLVCRGWEVLASPAVPLVIVDFEDPSSRKTDEIRSKRDLLELPFRPGALAEEDLLLPPIFSGGDVIGEVIPHFVS